MRAMIAFGKDWIDRLWVAPGAQAAGLGTLVPDVARTPHPPLKLSTFEHNRQARRFYQARGPCAAPRKTDRSRNEG